jgi:SAM-dependent methyltransferase
MRVLHGDFSRAAELEGAFDIVLVIGLIHHLGDAEASSLLDLAAGRLGPGGRVVTIDPCREPRQNRLASLIISLDRGTQVRDRAGYEAMAARVFASTRSFLRYDTLFYPYTHCILELSQPLASAGR